MGRQLASGRRVCASNAPTASYRRSEEHTSELQSRSDLVCRLLLEKKNNTLLMLGTYFPYRQFYPEHARIAQIDIRPEALGNRCPLELGLVGHVPQSRRALLSRLRS